MGNGSNIASSMFPVGHRRIDTRMDVAGGINTLYQAQNLAPNLPSLFCVAMNYHYLTTTPVIKNYLPPSHT